MNMILIIFHSPPPFSLFPYRVAHVNSIIEEQKGWVPDLARRAGLADPVVPGPQSYLAVLPVSLFTNKRAQISRSCTRRQSYSIYETPSRCWSADIGYVEVVQYKYMQILGMNKHCMKLLTPRYSCGCVRRAPAPHLL